MSERSSGDRRALGFEELENDVLAALAQHQRWREVVRRFGDVPRAVAAEAPSIRDCPLTDWLERRMHPRFRGLDLYRATVTAHERFHASLDLAALGRSDGTLPHAATLLKSYLDEWLTLSRVGDA